MTRVLIVDDSPAVGKRLGSLLRDSGEVDIVAQVTDLAMARALRPHFRPDAVILDIHLPDGSGIDLLEEIKRDRPETLAILFSSAAEDAYRRRGREAGADAFFDKATEFDKIPDLLRARRAEPVAP